jgi:glutaredoxin-dependent peroxiredoxin
VQVFGISVDSTWCHDAWRNQLDLPDDVVLLSDFNREFGEAYGLLTDSPSGMRGILRRTVFVIDPDRSIRYRWDVPDPPRIPTADEILEVLRKPTRG